MDLNFTRRRPFSILTGIAYLMFHPLSTVVIVSKCLGSFVTYLTRPWLDMFWWWYDLNIVICSKILSFGMKLIFLPIWVLTLFQKEKWLEAEIQETQVMRNDYAERKQELEGKLETAVRNYKRVKELLEKSEIQKKIIIEKFRVLQHHVRHLEQQNDALQVGHEIIVKNMSDWKSAFVQPSAKLGTVHMLPRKFSNDDDDDSPRMQEDASRKVHLAVGPSPKLLDNKTRGASTVDTMDVEQANMLPRKFSNNDDDDSPRMQEDASRKVHLAVGPSSKLLDNKTRGASTVDTMDVEQAKVVGSSFFSTVLCLLVRTITWKARDPCLPLVLAAFFVVCMSLKTVMQFLVSRDSRLGFNALVLLSFNWFLLGTLAHPLYHGSGGGFLSKQI